MILQDVVILCTALYLYSLNWRQPLLHLAHPFAIACTRFGLHRLCFYCAAFYETTELKGLVYALECHPNRYCLRNPCQ